MWLDIAFFILIMYLYIFYSLATVKDQHSASCSKRWLFLCPKLHDEDLDFIQCDVFFNMFEFYLVSILLFWLVFWRNVVIDKDVLIYCYDL